MTDTTTKKPLRVSTESAAGPYIRVSVSHIDAVRRLFDSRGVTYWIRENGFSTNFAGSPGVRYSEPLGSQGFGVPHPWACCKINKLGGEPFFDLLRLWLTAFPQNLLGKKVDFKDVLDAPDKDAITLLVVNKEVNEVMYTTRRSRLTHFPSLKRKRRSAILRLRFRLGSSPGHIGETFHQVIADVADAAIAKSP